MLNEAPNSSISRSLRIWQGIKLKPCTAFLEIHCISFRDKWSAKHPIVQDDTCQSSKGNITVCNLGKSDQNHSRLCNIQRKGVLWAFAFPSFPITRKRKKEKPPPTHWKRCSTTSWKLTFFFLFFPFIFSPSFFLFFTTIHEENMLNIKLQKRDSHGKVETFPQCFC